MTINLTEEQANLIQCYILLTTSYRKRECEAWKKIAEMKNEDGTPVSRYAERNAEYYSEIESKLAEISNIIDKAWLQQ